jgi:hypothetical protein
MVYESTQNTETITVSAWLTSCFTATTPAQRAHQTLNEGTRVGSLDSR